MNEQEKYDWMVYVSCMTYNHAPYIVDAMNGFTMQETNFPFVCAVVDDASTDGEQEVIKSYLNEHFDLEDKNIVRQEETDDYILTFARHKTNKNCYFAVLYLKYNHWTAKKKKAPYFAQWRDNAKYIAFCEGDDYWINPNKLQMQVDYLEKHTDCDLVRTNFNRKIQKNNLIQYDFTNNLGGYKIKDTYEDYLRYGWFNGPCTIMYRPKVTRYMKYFSENNYFCGTLIYTLTACRDSSVYYLDEITTCYRVLEKSACHFSDFKDTLLLFNRVKESRIVFANELDLLKRIIFYLFLSYQSLRMVYLPKYSKYWFQTIVGICGDFNKLFLFKRHRYRLPNYDKNS